MSSPQNPILVVDGNSILHRGYHALSHTGFMSPEGKPSWAMKAFWNMLAAAVQKTNPQGITIGFDSKVSTRKTTNPEYKSQRYEKDDNLRQQLFAAPEHFQQAGIQVVMVEGYEADDILASAAKRNQKAGFETILLTSDRDSFSLITDTEPKVQVLRVMNGGHANWVLLDGETLHEQYQVFPEEYLLYAAMRGDPSDNLMGVNGIGPKTAVKLIEFLRNENTTIELLLSDYDEGGKLLSKAIGKAAAHKFSDQISRNNFSRNLLLMRQDANLDIDPVDDCFLPLDKNNFQEEVSKWGLRIPSRPFLKANKPLPEEERLDTLFPEFYE